ncbi:uncharacterized protein N7458_004942 [Penicillium daleae]|uniref:Uncharacterized protein n=1 Tax=Penicillium daleae TaxID=63821 RepID=A0AAD6G324_9EURO|nr:uncharacterized protein N7458_004942 [Penicillium daleae]KAJ5453986.1 hypothetical protein N7458_004942 [Penicillium daleae]
MAVQVVSFFDQFPDFDCNPDSPISNEFKRLGKARNWRPGSKTWTKNWNRCMGNEYNRLIGSRISNLETWQVMCRKVGLGDEFTSIRQCKKALSCIYVNIIDLLECWETHEMPTRFCNVSQLAKYSKKSAKLIPREWAKQDKVLRVLLKRLL